MMAIRFTPQIEQRYEKMCTHVASLTDTLGTPIDPGIFETVVMLNLVGITTFQSCEGHLDHGAPYPWVTVIDTELSQLYNRKWLHVCELEEQAKEAGTPEAYDRYLSANVQLRLLVDRSEQDSPFYQRITSLLDTFYGPPANPNPSRLVIKRFKSSGRYRIEPGIAEAVESIPEHLKAVYLERGQAEMTAFTVFLKQQILLK